MNIPQELRYTKEHEWTKIADGEAVFGITEFAVEQLGDITLVELPEVGEQVGAGDSIGVVESVKAVSDLYAPLTGEVIAINEALEDAPEKINDDAYGEGWLVKMSVSDSDEAERLMDAEGYETFIDTLDED
ncbi:MAG: glycine cleavage system protein GcvH [Proteobacteria bacterium]|nr:glycine cleavage system protein GcvH [Pseudomonadota bacterium]